MSVKEDLIRAIESDYDIDSHSSVVRAVNKALQDPDDLPSDFEDKVEYIYDTDKFWSDR